MNYFRERLFALGASNILAIQSLTNGRCGKTRTVTRLSNRQTNRCRCQHANVGGDWWSATQVAERPGDVTARRDEHLLTEYRR